MWGEETAMLSLSFLRHLLQLHFALNSNSNSNSNSVSDAMFGYVKLPHRDCWASLAVRTVNRVYFRKNLFNNWKKLGKRFVVILFFFIFSFFFRYFSPHRRARSLKFWLASESLSLVLFASTVRSYLTSIVCRIVANRELIFRTSHQKTKINP